MVRRISASTRPVLVIVNKVDLIEDVPANSSDEAKYVAPSVTAAARPASGRVSLKDIIFSKSKPRPSPVPQVQVNLTSQIREEVEEEVDREVLQAMEAPSRAALTVEALTEAWHQRLPRAGPLRPSAYPSFE